MPLTRLQKNQQPTNSAHVYFNTEREKMKETPTLFELTNDLNALLDLGYSEEDSEAFMDTLNGIMGGIEDKADGYCAVISRFNANVDMIKAEEVRLAARRKVIENNIQRMKDALQMALETMEAGGMEKPQIKTGLHTIKLASNSGKQPLKVIEEKVPDSFKKIILETDKEKIREALEKGEALDFAELLPRGRHISIR